jgi:hypothetical protein
VEDEQARGCCHCHPCDMSSDPKERQDLHSLQQYVRSAVVKTTGAQPPLGSRALLCLWRHVPGKLVGELAVRVKSSMSLFERFSDWILASSSFMAPAGLVWLRAGGERAAQSTFLRIS